MMSVPRIRYLYVATLKTIVTQNMFVLTFVSSALANYSWALTFFFRSRYLFCVLLCPSTHAWNAKNVFNGDSMWDFSFFALHRCPSIFFNLLSLTLLTLHYSKRYSPFCPHLFNKYLNIDTWKTLAWQMPFVIRCDKFLKIIIVIIILTSE